MIRAWPCDTERDWGAFRASPSLLPLAPSPRTSAAVSATCGGAAGASENNGRESGLPEPAPPAELPLPRRSRSAVAAAIAFGDSEEVRAGGARLELTTTAEAAAVE